MVKLSAIQPQKIRKTKVTIGKHVLNLEVDTSALTIGWGKRIQDADRNGDIGEISNVFFALVKSWDLTDDDDVVYPLDESSIHRIQIETFMAIVDAIMGQLDPNAGTPKS